MTVIEHTNPETNEPMYQYLCSDCGDDITKRSHVINTHSEEEYCMSCIMEDLEEIIPGVDMEKAAFWEFSDLQRNLPDRWRAIYH